MSKRLIISSVIVGVFITALLFRWLVSSEPQKTLKTTGLPMKVAHNLWPGQYWRTLADYKGWFKEAGLNVELISSQSNYFSSLQSMVDGHLDDNNFSLYDLIRYNLKGADLVMVAASDDSFGADAIVVKSKIKKISDLKGKRIGVSKNTYLEFILSVVLNRHSVLLTDVELIDLPGEKMASEFIRGNLDAIVTWGNFITQAIEQGQGHMIFNTSEINGLSPAGIVFHRSFIRKRADDVQAYVNVWHKTTQFIKRHPQEAFRIIAKIYNRTPKEIVDYTKIDKILDLRDNITSFTYAAGFESLYGTAHKINTFMIQNGTADKLLHTTEYIDDRFIRVVKWQSK
jgi:NitT/TauT family transport system substrate-binding protein